MGLVHVGNLKMEFFSAKNFVQAVLLE